MDTKEIREYMQKLSEEDYKRFSSSLIPDIPKEKFLGIRLPLLRKLAKKIAKDEPLEFIESFSEKYFEDVMLKGFVIGESSFSFSKRCSLIEEHIHKINNWSLCDSFCSSLKFIRENEEEFLKFLEPYFISNKEYEARFAFVCLLDYYNNIERIDKNLELIQSNKADGFYAKMAKAWAISEISTKSPTVVTDFLKSDKLDDFTHNKAISKIRESHKISYEDKKRVLALKR